MAQGRREKCCVQNLLRFPPSPASLHGPSTYQATRDKKLRAIGYYLTLVKYLLPLDDSVNAFHLGHGDLHLENIFVDPQEPTKIVGIIDWQTTQVSPLYEHAMVPSFLELDGPIPEGLEDPELPVGYTDMVPAAQQKAYRTWECQMLYVMYKTALSRHIPALYKAMKFRQSDLCDFLRPVEYFVLGGEATYTAQVMLLEKDWDNLLAFYGYPAAPFPFQFSDEEKEAIQSDADGDMRGMEAMNEIQETLGDIPSEKWLVRHEDYDRAIDLLRQCKDRVIKKYAKDYEGEKQAWLDAWPFDC